MFARVKKVPDVLAQSEKNTRTATNTTGSA
jgi:hypothetical protein